MATAIQRRRGTTTQHNSFTGLAGEITIDTDKNTVVVHDGSQAGGYPLAKYSDVSALGGADITAVVAGAGLTGGSTSGDATINVVGGTGITVNADDIEITVADVRGLFSASGDLSYNSGTGAFSFTNDAGDIESVTAGNGLSGGGTSGAVSLALDLNELTAATVDVAADSIAIIDAGDSSSKQESIADLASGMAGTNITATSGTLGMADSVIRGKVSVTDAGGDGSLAYNNGTGVITYTGPSAAEVRAHFSAGGDLSYNSSTGVFSFTNDAGDIEGVTAGDGLSGGGTSGTVSLALDLNELTAEAISVTADSIAFIDATDNSSKKESVLDLVAGMAGTNITATSGTLGISDTVIRSKITAGDGMDVTGGEFAVDNTVVRTSGVQSIAGAKTFTADAIFSGNITINGTQTTVNTETLTVNDNLIVLNNNESGTPSEDAGIEVERGTSTNVKLQFKESTDRWQFTNDGSTYFSLPTSTADIAENTNLYYTDERVDDRVGALIVGGTNITATYNDSAGTLTIDNDNTADITAVTAGNGLSGGGTSGALSIALDLNELSAAAVDVTADSIALIDGSDNSSKKESIADLATAMAGTGITATNGVLSSAVGDITGVTAGSGISGGGTSGGVTVAVNHEAFSGNLIPSSNNTFQLGSATHVWKDVFVGPGSLYVNGQQVLSDNSGTITVSADTNQNLSIVTTGTGDIELTSGGDIQLKTDVVLSADKTITSSGGVKFASNVNMNSNNINNVDNPVAAQDAATKAYVDAQVATKDNSDEITEGSTNLYFTNERAQDAVGSIISGSGNVGVTYDDAAGTITVSENLTTTDITEGDNQYHTTARARGAVSATFASGDGGFAYNSSTGVFTMTGPSAAETRAHFSGSTGIDISSGAVAVDSTVVVTSGTQSIGGAKTFTSDAIFSGNITVNGTQTILNTETLTVDDNIIILNNNASGTPSENAGIQVARGSSSDVLLRWTEASDTWEFTNDGTTYYPIPTDTDDLSEGSSNLYYTNARADARVTAGFSAKSTSDLSEGTNLYYTNARADARIAAASTSDLTEGSNLYYTNARADARVALATGSNLNLGSKNTDDLSEGSTNLYHTSARADARFDVKMAAADTGDLSEGSNLYFTNARVDARLSGGTGITYSSGSISVTAGSIGATQLADSGVTAATYGDADSVASFTVDADGRITSASSVNIAIASGAVSGLASSATVDTTSASNISSGTLNSARLPDLAVADFGGAAIQTGSESFSDSDSVLMTAAAVNDRITAFGYTTNTGDITGVTAGSGLTGGGASGSVTLNIGAGTYMTVNADDIAVDATSANTASKVVARDGSGNFSAGTITATATNAQYADLAEIYKADGDIQPGSVVCFGGEFEITECEADSSHAVAGVISTDPAHLMNAEAEGLPVALAGRVPCKVTGPVAKGDLMVSSSESGHAKADNNAQPGRIIGKAIEAKEGDGNGVIEVLVNMM